MSNSLYQDQAQHFVGPDLDPNCLQKVNYCKFENFRAVFICAGFIFAILPTSNMRSFAKIKPSRNDEITLPLTDVGKSCTSHD